MIKNDKIDEMKGETLEIKKTGGKRKRQMIKKRKQMIKKR